MRLNIDDKKIKIEDSRLNIKSILNTRYVPQGSSYIESEFVLNSVNSELPDEVNEMLLKSKANVCYEGTKIKNEKDTGEKCFVFGVTEKKKDINQDEMIPETICGLKTDVVEYPELKLRPCNLNPQDKYRPIKGGVSGIIHNESACTIGAIVRDRVDKTLVALTNNHCNGYVKDTDPSSVGEAVLQPSPFDSGTLTEDTYGKVKRIIPLKTGGIPNLVDASISSIYPENPMTEIINIGEGPFKFETNRDNIQVGMSCKKNGRTSCYTDNAIIQNLNVSATIDGILYTNQMLLHSSPDPFIEAGDSGSAVLSNINGEDKILGLVFASGFNPETGVHSTLVCYADNIMNELKIEAWQGDIVVEYNVEDTININGILYERFGDTYNPITHKIVLD